ncbi:MAG: hypothetical protein HLX51_02065 [Micrococcaceae bacterium]|nr:hypothetical protein [Micrococcaceae bacterium]
MSTYTLDGIDLSDPSNGRKVLLAGTLPRVMAGRADNGVAIPGRDGVTPSLATRFEASSAYFRMTVRGQNREQTISRVERLFGMLGVRHRLMELVHTYGSTTQRVADVELLGEPSLDMPTPTYAEVDFVLNIPAGAWRSPGQVTAVIPFGQTVTVFHEATAPMQDALIRFTGAVTNPRLVDVATGKAVGVNATVPDYAVIDAAAWRGAYHTSGSWSPDGVSPMPGPVIHSNHGAGAAIVLTPDQVAGGVQLRAEGSSLGANAVAEVRTYLSYR